MSNARFETSPRSRVRRHPERAAHEEGAVFAILDSGVMAHVAYVIDGQPFVTPTAYWRVGRRLFWHGSAASRMLRAVAEGQPACVTVSQLDGFVLAPSGFAHSLNFRSVMLFGRARLIEDREAKREAVNAFIDRLYPGRSAQLRPASESELARTSVVEMQIEEASAKVRGGGVKPLEEDAGWGAWSGVIPVETRVARPVPDAALGAAAMGLAGASPYLEGARIDHVLLAAAARPLTPA